VIAPFTKSLKSGIMDKLNGVIIIGFIILLNNISEMSLYYNLIDFYLSIKISIINIETNVFNRKYK
jgi:hypothetical protein